MVKVSGVVALVFLFAACDDNNNNLGPNPDVGGARDGGPPRGDGTGPTGDGAPAGEQQYSVLLSGEQVVPRVTTGGSGTATIKISQDKSQIEVTLTVSNLGGLTGAEIQVGEVGARGPAIFVLDSQAFVNPLQRTLRASDVRPQPGAGVTNFNDAIQAIANGNAYVVVKTQGNVDGELRGQIGTITLSSDLSADQVNPPITTSSATGTARVVVAADQKSIAVTLTPSNVQGSSGAFMYAGTPGNNGPVIFKISTQPVTGPVTVTLRAADLTPQPAQNISRFEDAVDAVLAGTTYVAINTQAHPNGEVRGHVGRITLVANLAGANMVPPVTTEAGGAAQVNVPNSRKQIFIDLTLAGVEQATSATINVGATAASGPPMFIVAGEAFKAPLAKVLGQQDLTQTGGSPITSFADAIRAMLTGNAYVIVTTAAYPNGFMRGQLMGY